MKINLKILKTETVYAHTKCENLEEKTLVKKMMIRRRLTRGAKIAIFLASKVGYTNEKIVFGSAYGEVDATISILDAIYHKNAISPTAFQNSVHNTPVSYLSIISENEKEIVTVSDLFDTALSVLKTGAIKALGAEKVLLLNVDAFNFENVEQLNECKVSNLESGVAMLVEYTEEKANITIENSKYSDISPSLWQMLEICEKAKILDNPIVEIEI